MELFYLPVSLMQKQLQKERSEITGEEKEERGRWGNAVFETEPTAICSIKQLLQISSLIWLFSTPSTCHKHFPCRIKPRNLILNKYHKKLYSPVWGFWKQIMNNITRNISYRNADVTKVNVVWSNLSSVIAWLFPVQCKAHRRWELTGIHVLILQHKEGRDCIRYRCRDPAGYQFTVGSSSCLVNSLCGTMTLYRINVLFHTPIKFLNHKLCSLEQLHRFLTEDASLAHSPKDDSYHLPGLG